MPNNSNDPIIDLLLKFIDQAYNKKAWHGATLRGSLRGLTAKEALWRPAPKHHNIWELVIHCAYWKYVVRRKITGEERGSFPRTGSNWLQLPEKTDAAAWKKELALLQDMHAQLRDAVAQLSLESFTRLDMVYGIASHDLYHAGQIQLLKRLLRGGVVKAKR